MATIANVLRSGLCPSAGEKPLFLHAGRVDALTVEEVKGLDAYASSKKVMEVFGSVVG